MNHWVIWESDLELVSKEDPDAHTISLTESPPYTISKMSNSNNSSAVDIHTRLTRLFFFY